LNEAIRLAIKRRKLDPISLFSRFDADHDGKLSYTELQTLLDNMHLGFSAGDLADIVRFIDEDADGYIEFEQYITSFNVPREVSGL